MRRFLRAIGRGLEAVTDSNVWLWIWLVFGTIGFTVAIAYHFDIPTWTWQFGLVELGSAILSALLWLISSIILFCISQWIEWHV